MYRFALCAAIILFATLVSRPVRADIIVGTSGPFSGANAALGEQLRRGVQRAIDDINATGGLRGERLVLKAIDDGCDPKKAVDAATQLVSSNAAVVVGHYCSGASIPASKVYEAAGIVQISPSSTHPRFTDDGGWNVLRICPRDDAQGTAAGLRVVSRGANTRIALLNDQSPSSLALVAKVREALDTAGITPVIDESYKPGAKEYADLAQRLRNAGTDIVYLGGTYVESALIVRELRGMGSSAQFISGDALVTEDFWNMAKEAAEGTLMTFMFDPQKLDEARPVIERFKTDGFVPEGHTLYAYAALEAWVKAAEATGGTDSHRIASWLRAGNRIRQRPCELAFDTKGDLAAPRIAWYRWSDGHYMEETPAP